MKHPAPKAMPQVGDTVIVYPNGDRNLSINNLAKTSATVVQGFGGSQLNLNIQTDDAQLPVKNYKSVRHISETGDKPEESYGQCYWLTREEDAALSKPSSASKA